MLFEQPFREFSVRGGMNLAVSLVAVFLLSYFFVATLDKPIQLLRKKIKTKANRLNPPAPHNTPQEDPQGASHRD